MKPDYRDDGASHTSGAGPGKQHQSTESLGEKVLEKRKNRANPYGIVFPVGRE